MPDEPLLVHRHARVSDDATPLVAYQGVPGAFGETAIHHLWRHRARPYPAPTFAAALEALRSGTVACAVIPVWNSSTGPVLHSRRALDEYDSWVVQVEEVEIPVSLCLIARPGTSLADVRFVGSHPTALAQCKRLFDESSNMLACDAFNTAGAVRDLACYGEPARDPSEHAVWYARLHHESPRQLAAIASERAADHYGLTILSRDVNDDPMNRTRFVVLRSRPCGAV